MFLQTATSHSSLWLSSTLLCVCISYIYLASLVIVILFFLPVSCCFDHCSFVVWCEVREPDRFSSVMLSQDQCSQFSCSVMSTSLQPRGLQRARLPCLSPRACSKSCLPSWWCYPTLSSTVVPSSSCLQSFPASGAFQVSQFFASGGQIIGASASKWVFPMNIQNWFPLGWTGWISLQCKRLSRVFSNTTVQKHQFFGTQLSLWSESHIHTWPLEKP